MDLGLTGKVAMVAGASRGLGFAIAQGLSHEGVKVAIASRHESAIAEATRRIESNGGEALGVTADVRSAEAISRWHRAAVSRFGPVDILVTNSGGPPAGSTDALDDGAWQNAFDLILLNAVRSVRAVAPGMIERSRGSILMLTSSSVKEPIPNLALSNVMRTSVAALAKTLANELAGSGIRVNHLIPGRISTDRLREIDEMQSKKAGISVEQQQKTAIAAIPLARYGTPDEFARAAVFLVSDAASYITGATLQVDGGLIRSVI